MLIVVLIFLLFALLMTERRLRTLQVTLPNEKTKPTQRDASTQFPPTSEDLAADRALQTLYRLLADHASKSGNNTWTDETELRRHLEACNMNAAIACKRVLATEKWRATRAAPPLTTASTATAARRVAIRGTDSHGHPCLRVRLREPLETFPDELLRVLDEHFDNRKELDADGPSTKLCVLLDLRHFQLKSLQRPPLAAGFSLVSSLRAHYPQRLSCVHVIHMPPIGRWLVSLACSLMDSRTAKKITVHEAHGQKLAGVLSPKYFEVEQLPLEYGGKAVEALLPGEDGEHDGATTGTVSLNSSHSSTASGGAVVGRDESPVAPKWLDGALGGGMGRKSASAASELSTFSETVSIESSLPASQSDLTGMDGSLHGGGSSGSLHGGGPSGYEASLGVLTNDHTNGSPSPPLHRQSHSQNGNDSSSSKRPPRYVWSTLSEDEANHLRLLRSNASKDPELINYKPGFDADAMPDDELLRFLIDCAPPFDPVEGLQALRVAARARSLHIDTPLPWPRDVTDPFSFCARFDGVTNDNEPVFLVILSRRLQDEITKDPTPFLKALIGLMDITRREYFRYGEMESVRTVVQVERGFRLTWRGITEFTSATQKVLKALTDMYPSYTSKILVVNLPASLVWFVRFVKGFLCEASAEKIELINEYDELRVHFEPSGVMPSYYRERGSIKP